MFNKKNPMRYFSGSTFARLPLYKLAAGGTAVVLTASIGLGACAASVGPLSAPEPSPTPIVTATPETAATPTPSPTPTWPPSPLCATGWRRNTICRSLPTSTPTR